MSKPDWIAAPSIGEIFDRLRDTPDDLEYLVVNGDEEAASVMGKMARLQQLRTTQDREKRGLWGTDRRKAYWPPLPQQKKNKSPKKRKK